MNRQIMHTNKRMSSDEDREITRKNDGKFHSKLSSCELEAFKHCEEDGLAEKRYVGVNVLNGDYQIHYLVRL